MGKYDSKRVLHIGSGTSTAYNIDLVKRNGGYMIVADKCPPDKNRYRNLVDEVIQMDIDNLDEVIGYAKDNHIDAILTNFNEEEYETCRILNEAIGNVFFHTKEQWGTFMNKDNFRKLCLEYNIDVPETYYSGNIHGFSKAIIDSIKYPVIVKPVDNGGGTGISICCKKQELNKAVKTALANSASSRFIVEEYLHGNEITFTYGIQNGVCRLINSADKYVYKEKRGVSVIPDLYYYPCLDQGLYIEAVNDKVIKMIKSQGLDNCTIFFQTIEKNGHFYFFEAGLRAEGSNSSIVTKLFTGQNIYEYTYDCLLRADSDYKIELDDPWLNGHEVVTYAMHLKEGLIRKIEGISDLENNGVLIKSHLFWKTNGKVGKRLLGKVFASFNIVADDKVKLVNEIKQIKQRVKAKGVFGRNMIIDSFDESVLLKRNRIH